MTTTFKDTQGREWTVGLTVGVARKLKEEGIDLLNPDSCAEAVDDLYSRFRILWRSVERQAEKLGVSEDDFDVAIADEKVFVASGEAMIEALTSFFLRSGQKALAKTVEKAVMAAATLDNLAVAKIDGEAGKKYFATVFAAANKDMDTEIQREIERLEAGMRSSDTPESLASTPTT